MRNAWWPSVMSYNSSRTARWHWVPRGGPEASTICCMHQVMPNLSTRPREPGSLPGSPFQPTKNQQWRLFHQADFKGSWQITGLAVWSWVRQTPLLPRSHWQAAAYTKAAPETWLGSKHGGTSRTPTPSSLKLDVDHRSCTKAPKINGSGSKDPTHEHRSLHLQESLLNKVVPIFKSL